MGLLDGDIQALFGSVFGGIYLDATLHRLNRTVAADGDVATAETTEALKVQVKSITERLMDQLGIRDLDAALIVLQSGVSGPPVGDDEITVGSTRWKVKGRPHEDPARSHWIVGVKG